METLIYFLLFAALFAVMMRSGCGAHVFGHNRHGAAPRDETRLTPPKSAKDPVCGMVVETATAKTSMHAGQPHYFCSANCRERFEASPASFIGSTNHAPMGKEDHHVAQHRLPDSRS